MSSRVDLTPKDVLHGDEFVDVIRRTPLVSIDLVLFDPDGRALLGKRTNRPARGFWFVPGGRIRKNETIEHAFGRICRAELGLDADFARARFGGAYDHIYEDNYHGVEGITTHYVALGFEYRLDAPLTIAGDDQHAEFAWMTPEELLADPKVHENTKRYFSATPPH
jgi:colanic acid biosynthesis protein WcaH